MENESQANPAENLQSIAQEIKPTVIDPPATNQSLDEQTSLIDPPPTNGNSGGLTALIDPPPTNGNSGG